MGGGLTIFRRFVAQGLKGYYVLLTILMLYDIMKDIVPLNYVIKPERGGVFLRKTVVLVTTCLILLIAWAIFGGYVLITLATTILMVLSIAVSVKYRDKLINYVFASLMIGLAVATIVVFYHCERKELIDAKKYVISVYEPNLTVDDIRVYCRDDQFYGYIILDTPKPTTGVKTVGFTDLDVRYDISNDSFFTNHVEEAIGYKTFILLIGLIAATTIILQHVTLK